VRRAMALVAAGILFGLVGAAGAQEPGIEIPDDAVLEGLPVEREVSSPEGTERTALTSIEAAASGLRISVEDGRYSWASRGGEPLELRTGDGFTYLSSTRSPGQYIQITRIDDRLAYVEHLDTEAGHVIFRGELRITIGR